MDRGMPRAVGVARASARSLANRLLLCLLLFCALCESSRRQETAPSWDSFSRLIPTNSVYEQPNANVSPAISDHGDASPARTLDENNVMDAPKAEPEEDHDEQRGEEDEAEAYEDEYETETEARNVTRETNPSRIEHESNDELSDASIADTGSDNSTNGQDYVEYPSTNEYDAIYYYEDYDNSSRSRYKAAGDDVLDYPDVEEEEEEEQREEEDERKEEKEEEEDEGEAEEQGGIDENALKSRNASSQVAAQQARVSAEKPTSPSATPGLSDDERIDASVVATNLEEASSMEGSDKSFSVIDPPDSDDPDGSILIGEAVVSVVTTKSVVNGTISVPSTTSSPMTTEQVAAPPSSSSLSEDSDEHQRARVATTEDSSIVLASVQTSRSISGARFLPFPVIDRVEQLDHEKALEARKTSPPPESTESIIDKLDRVQSELSSGILAGGFRTAGNTLQLDVLADKRRRFTTTARTPVISKFVPRRYNDKRLDHASTTARRVGETTARNSEGPTSTRDLATGTTVAPGRPKVSGFRWPSKITTTSEVPETKTTSRTTTAPKKSKPAVVVQDISAFLPPGYRLKKEDAEVTEKSVLNDILAKSKVDVSSLLPPDYVKKQGEEGPATSRTATTTAKVVERSSEAPSIEKSLDALFAKSQIDISSLLPRDYEQKKKSLAPEASSTTEGTKETDQPVATTTATATTKKAGALKIVFPSRPGGRKPSHKITTPSVLRGEGPTTFTPRIQKGWPTRATTEFTGWPTPSTTPISIEKLLEAARTATVASVNASMIPTTSIASTTSTTSTTTTTPRPTTPGLCEEECEVAGTIRIIGNATWVPELLDRNTREWQELANEIEREMNFIFSKSAVLTNWYKSVRIDSFSQGSILVDYFVELTNLQQTVNTQELKVIFHDSLRTYNSNRWNDTRSKDAMRLGSFTIDPKYTDFIVIPKATTPRYIENDDRLIPQWAIAVIVIGVGGLLFIIVFGVSVLVNRQNESKLKPTLSTIYDEEVAKNIMAGTHATTSPRSSDYSKPVHTIWTDPDVSWNDKSFESTSNKMLVDRSYQDNKKYNLYDSWRSEWNGYYYNPSHTSSKYGGYDSTNNLSSRHHPDYDTNF